MGASGVINRITAFFRKVHKTVANSVAARFFCSDDKVQKAISSSCTVSKAKRSEATRRLKQMRITTARKIEHNTFGAMYKRFVVGLYNAPSRVLATFFVSFAIYSFTVCAVRDYVLKMQSIEFDSIAAAAVILLVGVMLMLSDRTVAELIESSLFGRTVLVKLLGVRETVMKPGKRSSGVVVAFIAGTLAGVLTIWLSPLSVLICFICAVCAMLIFASPECGVTLLLLAAPFLSDTFLTAAVSFVFCSYVLKLLRFKRNLRLGGAGIAVLLLTVNVILCGICSAPFVSGLSEAFSLISMMLCFFLAMNLISTDKLVFCCMRAILTSCFFASLAIILLHFVPTLTLLGELDFITAPGMGASVYIAVGGIIFVQRVNVNYSFFSRLGALACSIVCCAALYFTQDVTAMMLFVIGAVLITVVTHPKTAVAFIAVGAASPLWWKLLDGTDFSALVSSYFSGADSLLRAASNGAVMDAAIAHFAGGIGYGDV
ncbi:MAG TPA: hypothetical protein PLT66_05210, partial [Bacillota bacterium]|nr:hypothetical protein [Bacillota bacterium]